MKLYEKIKQYRLKMHLSQEYVAKYLGVNRASFTQIELGKRKITADELASLATLFGVSADSMLYDNSVQKPSVIFARNFEQLDPDDQAEIVNLMRFKELMKAQR